MNEKQDQTESFETKRVTAWSRALPLAGLAAAVIFSAFLAVSLYNLLFPIPESPSQSDIERSVAQAMASATPPPPDSTLVYQTILPSLVFVKTRQEDASDADDPVWSRQTLLTGYGYDVHVLADSVVSANGMWGVQVIDL